MARKALIGGALSAALLAVPALSFAQQATPGFYVGGAIGQTEAGDWCSTSGAPAGFGLSRCDDKDSGWKAFAGYRFNRHFAAEASYIRFGDFSGTVTFGGGSADVTAKADGWGVAALGIVPVGNNFELFGKLGFLRGESEGQVTIGGTSATVGSKGTELHYGFGGVYNFTRNLGIRAEWENVNDAELRMLSIGLQYRF